MLKVITATLGAGAAGSVGGPILGTVIGPASKTTVVGAHGFVPVGAFASLPSDGSPVALDVVVERPKDAWTLMPPTRVGAVYAARSGAGVTVFSTSCPHLGCRVELGRGEARFACPCHESSFGADGRVLEGPAPRGLDPLEARVVDGRVEVRFLRFRSGTPERIVV